MKSKKAQAFTGVEKIVKKRQQDIHPIWRGVGIALMVLIPVLGYVGGLLILRSNRINPWLMIPAQLIVPGPDPLILVKIILAVIIGAFIYFLLMLITFIIYRIFGPSRLGPLDVPPIHWKNKNM